MTITTSTTPTSEPSYTWEIPLKDIEEYIIERHANVHPALVDGMLDALVAADHPVSYKLLRWALQHVNAGYIATILRVVVLDTEAQYMHTVFNIGHAKNIAAILLGYLLGLPDDKFAIAKRGANARKLTAFHSLARDTHYAHDLARLFIRMNMLPLHLPNSVVLTECNRAGLMHPDQTHTVTPKDPLDVANSTIADLKKQIAELEAQKSGYDATLERLSTLETTLEALQGQLTQDNTEAVLQEKLDVMTAELLAARGDNSQLKANIHTMHEENLRLHSTLRRTQADFDKAVLDYQRECNEHTTYKKLADASIASFQGVLASERAGYAELRETVASLKDILTPASEGSS